MGGKMGVRDAQFARGFEPFAIELADVEFNGQRMEDAQVVGAPAPDAKQ